MWKTRLFLLEQPQAGMKTAPEEVVMTEKLPAVGATVSSLFLPSVAELNPQFGELWLTLRYLNRLQGQGSVLDQAIRSSQ